MKERERERELQERRNAEYREDDQAGELCRWGVSGWMLWCLYVPVQEVGSKETLGTCRSYTQEAKRLLWSLAWWIFTRAGHSPIFQQRLDGPNSLEQSASLTGCSAPAVGNWLCPATQELQENHQVLENFRFPTLPRCYLLQVRYWLSITTSQTLLTKNK